MLPYIFILTPTKVTNLSHIFTFFEIYCDGYFLYQVQRDCRGHSGFEELDRWYILSCTYNNQNSFALRQKEDDCP